jgi:ATP-dependent DNA helicase RecQ
MIQDYNNYDDALKFVDDYFSLNYSSFLKKYFPGSREDEINRTLTPEKFERLFGRLSTNQREIIKDKDHQYIVVAAAPAVEKQECWYINWPHCYLLKM